MKKMFLSLVVVVAGGAVIYLGYRRSESIAGVSDKIGADLANAFDGKVRQPEHRWYYAGGGLLVVAGLGLMLRGSRV